MRQIDLVPLANGPGIAIVPTEQWNNRGNPEGNTMLAKVKEALHRADEGATAVEYGIMVALIAIVIIAAVFFVGNTLSDCFETVGSAISESTPNEC